MRLPVHVGGFGLRGNIDRGFLGARDEEATPSRACDGGGVLKHGGRGVAIVFGYLECDGPVREGGIHEGKLLTQGVAWEVLIGHWDDRELSHDKSGDLT